MLPIVARSASVMLERPEPKNSTNLPTTPFLRSICVTVSTRSVAVTPFLELAGQPEADHFGQQHRHRLAEHRRLRLDAADAPAEHAEAVDHGGVRIGADAGVGIGGDFAVLGLGPHRLGEIFEIDLMADAGAGRHHAEIAERLLAPFQEFVALFIALVFELDIAGECQRRAELVDDHRMVDDEVDRNQRVDLLRIAAKRGHGVAHRREIDHGRHAGEILHQHAGRAIGDLDAGRALVGEPAGDRLDALLGDRAAVLVAQQVLEQHLHRIGQLRDAGQPVLLRLDQAEIDVLGAADVSVLRQLKLSSDFGTCDP